MLNADNRSSLSHSNASIQFNHQMAQALSQPIPNHLDAQQMLLQSRQFINSINSNSLMPGNNNQILYSDTYQANASSSNSSETQSSLNTQSTRDTAIGVTSSNGNGSRATLQEMNVITSTLGTSQPPPVFFDDRFSSNEYAIDPIHSGTNRPMAAKSLLRSLGFGK